MIVNLSFTEDSLVITEENDRKTFIPISSFIKTLSNPTVSGVLTGDITGKVSNIYDSTPVNAVAATLSTALTGDNNDMVFTAKNLGAIGNSVSITYVDPAGNNKSLSIVVTDLDIVVNLATGGAGAITTIASDIKTAIDADEYATALVSVANKADNDGTGLVTAMAEAALTGGVDGTEAAKGGIYFDATYLYLTILANTTAGQNWRRISLGSAY